MHNNAEAHLQALQPPGSASSKIDFMRIVRKYRLVFSYGVLSIALYALLYYFSADLVAIARDTHAGHKAMFFLPIVLALVFSVIHGAFTSHFWDVLGVKARKSA